MVGGDNLWEDFLDGLIGEELLIGLAGKCA